MSTNGRGHVLEAVMVWPWARCSAMQYLHRGFGPPPDWIAVVPASYDRPPWIPPHARHHALSDGESAYTWTSTGDTP